MIGRVVKALVYGLNVGTIQWRGEASSAVVEGKGI